jgi:hypothetical protein
MELNPMILNLMLKEPLNLMASPLSMIRSHDLESKNFTIPIKLCSDKTYF